MANLDINISEVEFLPKPINPQFVDLEGRRFGFLIILGYWGKNRFGNSQWLCQCSCGNYTATATSSLTSGRTTSCGCWHRKIAGANLKTHGQTNTPEHSSWSMMLTRCRNPHFPSFADYGGRGITVCERWLQFENFLQDMGKRPVGTTLERVDNEKGYAPDNCIWTTRQEQANNKRNNRILTLNGRQQTMAQWSREMNIPQSRIFARLKLGWSDERALTEPKHINRRT